MSKTITLFMWGYQDAFRVSMEIGARSVIEEISPTLQPRMLLVGVRTPERTDGHPVCVEPESGDWDPRLFFGCADRTEEIYADHPSHALFYGDAPSMRDKPENIRKASVREAVQEVTDAYDSENGTSSFCGLPTRVEGYHVVPVLQFDKPALLEYPRLPELMEFDRWQSSIGFLESTIEQLLDVTTEALAENEPGRNLNLGGPDVPAILRRSGDRFCWGISLSIGDVALQDVFNSLNVISSLPYEGSEAIGTLVFSSENANEPELRVRFRNPIRLHDHRMARKIIEMSRTNLACVCKGAAGIVGLGTLREGTSGGFRVVFSGHYTWELYYDDTLIMKTAFGVPRLPAVPLKEEAFHSNIRRIFPAIDETSEDRLWSIVSQAITQKHGTMIVVSDSAEAEAKRLSSQSIRTDPAMLESDFVGMVTGIDGAVLINPRGTCYAIGVILDGMATLEGDMSRGARYNSALRYITSAESPTVCLVVSEDGYVDMIPYLRPQVRKSEIVGHVEQLKGLNHHNFHKTRNWLGDHRFYLTGEQCGIVNKELERINNQAVKAGKIAVILREFTPHPEMDSCYYLPDRDEAAAKNGNK